MSKKHKKSRQDHQHHNKPFGNHPTPSNQCQVESRSVCHVRIEPTSEDHQWQTDQKTNWGRQITITKVLNYITGAAAVVGLLYVLVNYGMLLKMREANKISHDALYAQQRPWLGLDFTHGGLNIEPLTIDDKLLGTVFYSPVVKNFGNYPAQSAFVIAQLYFTGMPYQAGDPLTIPPGEDDVCRPIGPGVGDMVFPNDIPASQMASVLSKANSSRRTP